MGTLGNMERYVNIQYIQSCVYVCVSKILLHKTYHSAAGCAASEGALAFTPFASH